MAGSYEYQVCNVQQGHVTFVNGVWQGSASLSEVVGLADPFKFCVEVWDYLRIAGADGWEPVAAVTHEQKDANYDVLYLKRQSY